MRIENWLIALVIFSLIIVTGVGFVSEIDDKYGTTMRSDITLHSNQSINNVYNFTTALENTSKIMKSRSMDANATSSNFDDIFLRSGYQSVRLVSSSFGLVFGIVDDLVTRGLINDITRTAFIAIITISIVFALIYLILRYKPSD